VLSLIDAYLTEEERKQVGGAGLKKFTFAETTVTFGMLLNQATPAQVQIMRDVIPGVPWKLFSVLGPRAYVKYAARLHSASSSALPVSV
jgi:hypothetical protein